MKLLILKLPRRMSNWKETTLGRHIDIKHGFAFKGEFFSDIPNGTVLLTPGNFDIKGGFKKTKVKSYTSDIPSDYVLDEDDVIVTMTDLSKDGDTLGYSALIPKDLENRYLHNQRIGLVQVKSDEVDKKYIYWLMRWREYQRFIVNTASGSTVRHTSPKKIQDFTFLLPPLEEQKKIAGILGSLDDKIDLLQKENETLEKLAQTLFKRWFVNFEFPLSSASPAKGGEGRSVRGYKSSGGKMIDSKLGPIPEGWRVESLTSIATFLNGLAMQKFPARSVFDSFPVIKIKEMSTGITEQTDRASKDVPEKYIVNFGDVLFSWSGSLDIDVWKHDVGVLNQHLFKVTSESYPKWFYYYWIKEHLSTFQQIATAKAVTMGHIQRHHLDDALVVIPDEKFFGIAKDIFSPLLEKMLVNHAEIKSLSRSRDMLLPKLMSGEISCGD